MIRSLCLSLLLLASPARAADIHVDRIHWQTNDGGREVAIRVTGGIVESDMLGIFAALDEARKADQVVTFLWLDSWGGDGDGGMAIARWVYETRMPVFIDRQCLSSCAFAAMVALGSVELLITDEAQIGVHQVRNTDTNVPNPRWTRRAADRLYGYGAPKTLLDIMCSQPPEHIRMLPASMLSVLGAKVVHKPFMWGWW